jgi:hypothetical protein
VAPGLLVAYISEAVENVQMAGKMLAAGMLVTSWLVWKMVFIAQPVVKLIHWLTLYCCILFKGRPNGLHPRAELSQS